MKLFGHPQALEVAVGQLDDAKRELLMAQAAAESFHYHAQAEEARASALRGRIVRLKAAIKELKGEWDEANS